ncbi:MAG: hypothetical protein BWK73_08745, partial [Thiothrix lacustris]
MNKSILMTAAIAALFSSPAFAGGSLFGSSSSSDEDSTGAIYGGASIGQSSDSTCNAVADQAGLLLDNVECPTPSAWKVFGGYEIAPNLAIEGAYIDFGEASADSVIPAIPGINAAANPASLTTTATGFNASGVANAPVTEELSVFGKAGLTMWDRETAATVQNVGASAT